MDVKTCLRCKKTLKLIDFTKRTPTSYKPYCNSCVKEYAREHYLKNIEKYKERAKRNRQYCLQEDCGKQACFNVLGQPPRWCVAHKPSGAVMVDTTGEIINVQNKQGVAWLEKFKHEHSCEACGTADSNVLEFHHLDRSTKVSKITTLRTRATIAKIQTEIAKCAVLCRNCHMKVTNDENESYKSAYIQNGSIPTSDILCWRYKLFMIKFLVENPCVKCGCSDLRCLECDHIDPRTKTCNISEMKHMSIEKITEELAHCQVLCGNCHLIKTKQSRDTAKKRKIDSVD